MTERLRIVLGSYLVRYPLGGMMSWVLQYLIGLHRLGHDVWYVESAGYPRSCYDPTRDVMSDDCAYGIHVASAALARFGLDGRWCYRDTTGTYHGRERAAISSVFDGADVFLDMGTHGDWLEDAEGAGLRVLVDGEPGFTQMKLQRRLDLGERLPDYDRFYTTGWTIGTPASSVPTAGLPWGHLFHPVVCDLFDPLRPPPGAPYTTVMNWRSYEPLEFRGSTYGHKDREFGRFLDLPGRVDVPLEVAVAGDDIPHDDLVAAGWRVQDAHEVTTTIDAFWDYLRTSRGEVSVCKQGYVATRNGWFSDRGAAYLALGRPVIQQDTGFGAALPTGQGLFAASGAEDAAAAIEAIERDPDGHARSARELAREHLDAPVVLGPFLEELGR